MQKFDKSGFDLETAAVIVEGLSKYNDTFSSKFISKKLQVLVIIMQSAVRQFNSIYIFGHYPGDIGCLRFTMYIEQPT